MSDNNNNEKEEPEAKRLRSSEPDLCIMVGADGDTKEYHYHSQVMASHSSYIDTTLATPMKESQSLRLNFPDITPVKWNLMMKYLDPLQARSLDMEHAMKLAPYYDKYSFTSGLRVCDDVLTGIFKSNCGKQNIVQHLNAKPNPDLDTLISIFLLANDANLQETMKHACEYFREVLTANCIFRYGRVIFTREQIQKLAPLIVEKKLLKSNYTGGWTDEEIMNPMFPEYFVLFNKQLVTNEELGRAVVGVRLSGSSSNADGDFIWNSFGMQYACGRKVTWSEPTGRVEYNIFIGCLSDDWVIYGETDPELDEEDEPDYDTIRTKIMWRNPYSTNLPLPPKTGWEQVDELARGNPTLEYIYRENQE